MLHKITAILAIVIITPPFSGCNHVQHLLTQNVISEKTYSFS